MGYEEQDDEDVELSEDTIRLKQLFADRDNDYIDATQEIVDIIGPTLLDALYRLFNVPVMDVRWLDFSSATSIIIITCGIAYDPSEGIPKFILDTNHTIPKDAGRVEQVVRIGVPYELVMADSDKIVAFMSALVMSHASGGPTLIEHMDESTVVPERYDDAAIKRDGTVAQDASDFNPNRLTPEQRQQLLIFQHQSKGKIH